MRRCGDAKRCERSVLHKPSQNIVLCLRRRLGIGTMRRCGDAKRCERSVLHKPSQNIVLCLRRRLGIGTMRRCGDAKRCERSVLHKPSQNIVLCLRRRLGIGTMRRCGDAETILFTLTYRQIPGNAWVRKQRHCKNREHEEKMSPEMTSQVLGNPGWIDKDIVGSTNIEMIAPCGSKITRLRYIFILFCRFP